jgi:hypothetical protein
MLDARTMAVRRKLHRAFRGRGIRVFGELFGQKTDKEVERVEVEGTETEDVEVLRPVRNRRWQF